MLFAEVIKQAGKDRTGFSKGNHHPTVGANDFEGIGVEEVQTNAENTQRRERAGIGDRHVEMIKQVLFKDISRR